MQRSNLRSSGAHSVQMKIIRSILLNLVHGRKLAGWWELKHFWGWEFPTNYHFCHQNPWKNEGVDHLKTRLFTINTSKNVGFGALGELSREVVSCTSFHHLIHCKTWDRPPSQAKPSVLSRRVTEFGQLRSMRCWFGSLNYCFFECEHVSGHCIDSNHLQ